jgi:hypothetical protein
MSIETSFAPAVTTADTASASTPTWSASAAAFSNVSRVREVGVREQQLERARLLLAGDRPRSCADRVHEQEQRHHEREQLRVEITGARGEVEPAADERLERLGVVLHRALEIGVALDARINAQGQQDVRGRESSKTPRRAP